MDNLREEEAAAATEAAAVKGAIHSSPFQDGQTDGFSEAPFVMARVPQGGEDIISSDRLKLLTATLQELILEKLRLSKSIFLDFQRFPSSYSD